MKRTLIYFEVSFLTILDSCSQSAFNGLEMNMGNLYRLSNAKNRSITRRQVGIYSNNLIHLLSDWYLNDPHVSFPKLPSMQQTEVN